VGTAVTITGTNFGSSQGTSTVTFNGTAGTPSSWSATSIHVPVPTGATTGNVLVTVGGVASNPYGFEVGTAAPNITNISPTSGAVATSVTITGTGFGSTQGANTVNFNGVSSVPTSWSATQIKVPVPKGATTGSVVVTASGTISNGVNFTVPGTGPSITGLSPSLGPVGTSVTIAGTNFDATQGTSTVTFNGIPATATGWSPTSIVATVPSGATSGSVVVTVSGAASSGFSFTVAPSITSLAPTTGAIGTSVNISGTSFGSSQGTSTVTFNGTATTPTSWGASSITVPVPTGATAGNVVVTVSGVASNGVGFTVLPTPSITSLSPTSGAVGTSVTIAGSNFGATQGTSTVTFNGTVATPTSWGASSITVPVPTGATTGSVVVTVTGVASAGSNFTVVTKTLNSLALTPTRASISVGSTMQFVLTGTYSDGSQQNLTSQATWSSSVTSVATIGTNGLATPAAVGQTTIQATVGSVSASATLGVVSQTLTGSLPTAMGGNTLNLLEDSTVLVAGGYDSNGQSLSVAEIYNSATGSFVATGSLNAARSQHTATLLNDGTVLIAGGFANGSALSNAELYLPAAGTFLPVGSLNSARSGHTATLLASGQVLIAGGADSNGNSLSSAELYDPTTGTFSATWSLNTARQDDTATILSNGMVLIAGGVDVSGNVLQSAELYNPATGAFSAAGSMTTARADFTATLLNNGLVLIAGGVNQSKNSQASAELYNPTAGTFASTGSMNSARGFFTATLLNNGTVLTAGGLDASGNVPGSAELYDPVSATFTFTSNFVAARYTNTAVLLSNGSVLEVGGLDSNFNRLASAELYQPSTLTPRGLVSIAVSPISSTLAVGATQSFIATGTFSDSSTQTLASVTWSSSNSGLATISSDATNHGTADAVAVGSTTISACTGLICASSTLTIAGPSLVSITLNPQNLTMPLGTTQQFTATGNYADGSAQDLTSTATWSSSSSATTVSSSGLVTGVSLGDAVIKASSGSVSVSASVTVSAPALVGLTLSPSTATIAFGGSQQYQVVGTYTDGSSANLTTSVIWFAVPSETASVNGAGLATGLGQGTATITAISGSIFAVGSLTVQAQTAPSLVAVVVTPKQASVPVGSSQQFIATGNYSDGSTQDLTATVTWTSSSGGVAGVSSSGLATATGQGSSTLTATSGSFIGTATISVTASTLALNSSRYEHSATLLNNGSVLIAGGVSCASAGSCVYLNSAELYNPGSGTITYTGSLAFARSAPAVLLGNGKVLIAGGYSCDTNGNCASLKSTEIYDPSSSSFSSAGNMTSDRYGHTMTLLASGKVLIVGGETCSSSTSCSALNTADLYDPVAGTFTATGSLSAARFNASAAVLSSGQVLIAGGFNGSTYPAIAELYDPVAGSFSTTGSLNKPRANATANWLESSGNMILVAGGSTCNSPGCPTAAAEYYQNGSFYSLGNMLVPRFNQTATLLTNGQLFLAGGFDSCASSCVSDATSAIYNPQTYSFTTSQALTTGRSGHTATLLTDGSVLLIGGINNGVTLASTDSYQPSSLALPGLSSFIITPSTSPMAVGSTLLLVATGANGLGVLQPLMWTSSSPSVASVSNAAGSAGIVSALGAGTTTITASVGTISATAQISVTPALVSITVSPANPFIALNTTQLLQLTATGNYSDGSSSNLTSYVNWTNSNTSVARLMPNLGMPSSEVTLIPLGVGTANFTATFGGVTGSATVSVLAPPTVVAPTIVSVSPTAGSAGTQVTIVGSGFGAAQGTGTVWLGTTLGTVVSWSDGQVIATVNTGSTSGAAEIQQGGLASNAVPFTVNTPAISRVTPTSGLGGTQVTITGSGFGAVQGSGIVLLGDGPGVVTSWSDGQVVATVAPGASSGRAQILQSGVWSNSVPFTINSPHIASIGPNSGAAGTQVTINGNGFGATQGNGVVWIGSTAGVVASWSDTQVIANVASSALSGVAKIQQNGSWSNAVTFTVPATGGTATPVNVAPYVVTMVPNGTQPTQALTANGQAVTGLTWTSSNPAVATVSSDDPPTLTAVGPGNATITVGNASIDVTVQAGPTLATGTLSCGNPGDGSGVTSIMPAVPSPTGVADVFALQADWNVLAITKDCLTAWTAPVATGSTLIPDFQGGLIVTNGQSIYKLDGMTGQAYPKYSSVSGDTLVTPVPHTDGTIFTVDGDQFVGIDPQTGSRRVSVGMNDSTVSSSVHDDGRYGAGACYSSPIPGQGGSDSFSFSFSPPSSGSLMIAGDGYAYVPYGFTSTTTRSEVNIPDPATQLCTSESASVNRLSLRLLRLGTSGDSYEFSLGAWSSASDTLSGQNGFVLESAPLPSINWATPITNGGTGVLFAWSIDTGGSGGSGSPCSPGTLFAIGCVGGNTTVNLATTSGTGLTSQTLNIPGGNLQPVLQRADSSYVGTDGTNMFAFTSAGTQLWTVPNETPQIATADGGIVGASGVTYDQNGNATGRQPLSTDSWIGNAYQGQGAVDQVSSLPADYAPTYAALGGGNPSSNGTAIKENPFPRLRSCYNPKNNTMCSYDSLLVGLQALQTKVGGSCVGADHINDCSKYVFNVLDPGGVADQAKFSSFINRYPGFFNGTTSTLVISKICEIPVTSTTPWEAGYGCYAYFSGGSEKTVADMFKDEPDLVALAYYQPTNAQDPSGKQGLTIFFNPSRVCAVSPLSDNGACQIENASLLFHEGLHEYYGFGDSTIQSQFGIQVRECTANISDYISFWIFDKWTHSCSEPETLGRRR